MLVGAFLSASCPPPRSPAWSLRETCWVSCAKSRASVPHARPSVVPGIETEAQQLGLTVALSGLCKHPKGQDQNMSAQGEGRGFGDNWAGTARLRALGEGEGREGGQGLRVVPELLWPVSAPSKWQMVMWFCCPGLGREAQCVASPTETCPTSQGRGSPWRGWGGQLTCDGQAVSRDRIRGEGQAGPGEAGASLGPFCTPLSPMLLYVMPAGWGGTGELPFE